MHKKNHTETNLSYMVKDVKTLSFRQKNLFSLNVKYQSNRFFFSPMSLWPYEGKQNDAMAWEPGCVEIRPRNRAMRQVRTWLLWEQTEMVLVKKKYIHTYIHITSMRQQASFSKKRQLLEQSCLKERHH